MNQVIIIGSGLSGLSAAYRLSNKGYQVTVLEKSSNPGGLASSIKIKDENVEQFYHFICRTDNHLLKLTNDLRLSNKIYWQSTRTAFFHNSRKYPFGTPFDLINFKAVPLVQRFRFGIHIFLSRYRSNWRHLDQVPGKDWLIQNIGEEAYFVIWHPLLKIKFGMDYDKISAAWIWHRIWRVARSRRNLFDRESFGYFNQGSFTLINALLARLQGQGVKILYNKEVNEILMDNNQICGIRLKDETLPCQSVISTVALPILKNLLLYSNEDYFRKLNNIKYIGVVCMLLSLKQSFSKNFWTNINDPRIPFNGIIEQTNLNQHYKNTGLNLLYIPYYLDTQEPRYNFSDEYLFHEYIQALKIINPSFNKDWIKEWFVFRDPYAQAICTTDFASQIPSIKTPVKGLYVTDSAQFYPEDRTINSAINIGIKSADLLVKDFPHGM